MPDAVSVAIGHGNAEALEEQDHVELVPARGLAAYDSLALARHLPDLPEARGVVRELGHFVRDRVVDVELFLGNVDPYVHYL